VIIMRRCRGAASWERSAFENGAAGG
jgi:hypothetical protein